MSIFVYLIVTVLLVVLFLKWMSYYLTRDNQPCPKCGKKIDTQQYGGHCLEDEIKWSPAPKYYPIFYRCFHCRIKWSENGTRYLWGATGLEGDNSHPETVQVIKTEARHLATFNKLTI
jgi:hypothetical protein